jgi:hypothetical protein
VAGIYGFKEIAAFLLAYLCRRFIGLNVGFKYIFLKTKTLGANVPSVFCVSKNSPAFKKGKQKPLVPRSFLFLISICG